ncbi:hypothetical protein MD484_g1039, partial [Candolleomyces efflorescens]
MVYPHHGIYSEMFVVPVGALFAFTSIRANLPGAPDGFGTTLDMFSILPVLIIMSFCSFALLLIVLYRRISQITGLYPNQQPTPPLASAINLEAKDQEGRCTSGLDLPAAATPNLTIHSTCTEASSRGG